MEDYKFTFPRGKDQINHQWERPNNQRSREEDTLIEQLRAEDIEPRATLKGDTLRKYDLHEKGNFRS